MGNLIRRLLENIFFFFSAIFNIRIKLKYVILTCALLAGGTYFLTHSIMLRNVGGKEDYAEAMRYIEIKDIVSEKFIDEVNRDSLISVS